MTRLGRMPRPSVDVVIPFAGSAGRLRAVAERLAGLDLRPGDSAVIADNRVDAVPVDVPVRLVPAQGQQSSYFARNRGAEAGRAEWLLFLDADVEFDADLLDRLFDPLPDARAGVLAGAIEDAVVVDGPVARWLRERQAMSQANTLGGVRPYAQTAHAAVRRAAFAAVGGFAEGIRSGGDADLCFRIAQAGWTLEMRDASVRHEARSRLGPLLGQMARHGAGMAWIERRHPGTFPARGGAVRPAARLAGRLPAAALARGRGDRDRAARLLLEPATALAMAVGHRLSNDAPTGPPSVLDRWLR